MKTTLKGYLILFLLLAGFQGIARAGQQVYLTESPNGKYRVIVEQVIDRRVGDKVFFRYPLLLVNTRDSRHHFEMVDVGTTLIHETDKGTFQLHSGPIPNQWESIHFEWAKDSLKLFFRLEVIEGMWKTYFVNVSKGTTKDITADLQENMMKKVEFHDWACQQPTVEVIQWIKPHLAFLKLTSTCGKEKEKLNKDFFYLTDSVLYDTKKEEVVSHCIDCKNEKSVKVFEKFFKKTQVTPTPTPEETPTAQ
jgi:hypothetical protein